MRSMILPEFSELVEKLPALGDHPRVQLCEFATPLEPMRGVSAHFGQDISIKRDDLLPLAMAHAGRLAKFGA